MAEPNPLEELIALVKEAYDGTCWTLDGFRRRIEDALARGGIREPITKTQSRVLKNLLMACSLYQPDSEVRRKSWGTQGPAEFLRALEYTLEKIGGSGRP
jgi:hypothetical protein